VKRLVLKLMRAKPLQPAWAKLAHISRIGQNHWATAHDDSGEVDLLRRLAPSLAGGVLFDVGANAGQWAADAFQIVKPRALYSFEPSSAAHERLKAGPGVTAVNMALGSKAGQQTLHSSEPGATIGSLLNLRDPMRAFTEACSEQVEVGTVDQFCTARGVERIDFLKIDVEGSELAVLQGAEERLVKRAVRFVQFEFGEGHIDARTYLRDFFDVLEGFDLYRIIPGGIVPLGQYRPELEVFASVNYLAVLRT
jgi:FkbM family methyltransferase